MGRLRLQPTKLCIHDGPEIMFLELFLRGFLTNFYTNKKPRHTILVSNSIQIQIQKVVYFNCYISEVQRLKGLKPCWAYLPPSFDHNIHIHDDLIIGKTVLVQTKNILTHWPLWDLGDLTDDNSTLFQATAWCPLTTSHYLRQCYLR